jgi:hypothetical protein
MPRTAETLEELDLLLVMVATSRVVRRQGAPDRPGVRVRRLCGGKGSRAAARSRPVLGPMAGPFGPYCIEAGVGCLLWFWLR